MEFRVEASIIVGLLLTVSGAAAEEGFRFPARHQHVRKWCVGTLVFREDGVAFAEETRKKPRKKPHAWAWKFGDIQQLSLESGRVTVLTYDDQRWKLGADRELNFHVAKGSSMEPVYQVLRAKLDQRFVARLADASVSPTWKMEVKHAAGLGGTKGSLIVGEDRIVYQTAGAGQSRTWRYSDIENVSTEGPFQLTVTTFERSRAHYGNRKHFNFQLKEPLREERFNELWRRLDQARGVNILSRYQNEGK